MPLESLGDEQINIHDLTIEHEKKQEPNAKEQYETLKTTELYDKEKNQWNARMYENKIIGADYDRYIVDQLCATLVESIFNKTSAHEMLSKLNESPLFDKKNHRWNHEMYITQKLKSSDRYSRDQLFGILVESQFDKESALKSYKILKETRLYDDKEEQWNNFFRKEYVSENDPIDKTSEIDQKDERFDDYNRLADVQLLGILVEAQFNIESAKKLYDAIKETRLFDAKSGLWHYKINEDQDLPEKQYAAEAQLLGVLVESLFNKSVAQGRYDMLKKSDLYDEIQGMWYCNLNKNQELLNAAQLTVTQLLGVMCESEFEEKEPDINNGTPPLPEERNY